MKEAQYYMSPVMMLLIISYFILIGISLHELTNAYFIIPFMNIFAPMKQLNLYTECMKFQVFY